MNAYILTEKPEWIMKLNEAGWKTERADKLSWRVYKDKKEPLTRDDIQAIDAVLFSYSVELVDELMEYEQDSVSIGGLTFAVALPLTVVYRNKTACKAMGPQQLVK